MAMSPAFLCGIKSATMNNKINPKKLIIPSHKNNGCA